MDIVDEILSKVDIVDIISKYVDLKKSGDNYKWLCPFHNEKTPSFIVSESKQIFKCFWCWKWWNAITFIKEIENIDFYEAIKILAQKTGIELKKYKTSFKKDEQEFEFKHRIVEINKTALNFFHKKLFEDKKALNYLLQERKLSKEIIIKYKLWFSWTNNIEFLEYIKEKWFKQEELIQAGLAKKSSSWWLYVFFANRIIFPIFSSIWEPIAFSWRVFNNETDTSKYINTPETILYNKSWILYNFNNAKKTKKDFLIVCEWYMDVIWADRFWYDNTVATCWTALTEKHITLLKRITKNIIFAFDADNAWFQATLRWIKIALSLWIYPLIYNIIWWKDFDDIANIWEKPDIQNNAKDAIIYFMDYFLKDYKNLTATNKQEKLDEIFDIFKNIKSEIILDDYCEILSEKINKNFYIIKQQFKNKNIEWRKKLWENQTQLELKNMIPAILYNNFYKQFVSDNKIDKIIEKIIPILNYIDDNNILKQILWWENIDNKKEELMENQLIWEHNLTSLSKEKINNILNNEIKQYILKKLTDIVKDTKIKDNLKIIKVLNEIKKE